MQLKGLTLAITAHQHGMLMLSSDFFKAVYLVSAVIENVLVS